MVVTDAVVVDFVLPVGVGIAEKGSVDTVDLTVALLYHINQVSLMVALQNLDICSYLICMLFYHISQIAVGLSAVNIWLSDAQHI